MTQKAQDVTTESSMTLRGYDQLKGLSGSLSVHVTRLGSRCLSATSLVCGELGCCSSPVCRPSLVVMPLAATFWERLQNERLS